MSKPRTPPAPPPPDPVKVAAAQTGSNITTAQANSVLANANQYSPYGSTEFTINGYQTVYDPSTGKAYQLPKYNQTTTLSPAEQAKYDQENQLGGKLGNIALEQADRIGGLLGSPISAPMGDIQRNLNLGQARTDLGPQDWSADRQRVEEAIYSRLNPQLDRDRDQLENRLINQGFVRGTEGFNQAMDEANRQANDARMQAILAGGTEQSRLAGLDLQQGQFYNAGVGQNNQAALGAGQFANQAYGQDLQTQLALRNQPVNEISALMSGNQVSLPQFQGYQGGNVANTPVGDYYYQTAALQNQQYQAAMQARAQAQAGLYGGIGSVLGAGLYGFARR